MYRDATLLAIACIFWGLLGLFVKILYKYLTPLIIAFTRTLCTLIFVLIVIFYLVLRSKYSRIEIIQYLNSASRFRFGNFLLNNYVIHVMAGILGFGIAIPEFFMSLQEVGVFITYTVGLGLYPVILIILEVYIAKEEYLTKDKIVWASSLIIAITTASMIYEFKIGSIVHAVIFSISWSLYVWLISRLTKLEIHHLNIEFTDLALTTFSGLFFMYFLGTYIYDVRVLPGIEDALIIVKNVNVLAVFLIVIILCTLTPYMIVYTVIPKNPENSFWLAIFQYLEIFLNIVIGLVLLKEFTLTFQNLLLLITSVIFFIVSMIYRYREITIRKLLKTV